MALTKEGARELTATLKEIRATEASVLDPIYKYLRGTQAHPFPVAEIPPEVRKFLNFSRVNVVKLVVDVLAQSLFVDGFRRDRSSENDAVWEIWQANRLDSRQHRIHRGVFTYGASYALVLPGDIDPVIRGLSPRYLTVVYGEDPDWPLYAMETVKSGDNELYRVYDEANRYNLSDENGLTFIDYQEHGMGVCPIVRYMNVDDPDEDIVGEIAPLMALQDQIDLTTFGLMVAQHYGAFKQRYIIGWLAETEEAKLKASASRLLTFDDPEVKLGEFAQTDLEGYLKSREATLQHLAIISQTPPHNLLGQMINLSAEALAAAESGHRRKINERETMLGESHEQTLNLAGSLKGIDVDRSAQVRWRDTEARALSSTVDALGKMAQMLGIPPQELWERIPNVTDQDIARWKAAAAEADSLGALTRVLDEQGAQLEGF